MHPPPPRNSLRRAINIDLLNKKPFVLTANLGRQTLSDQRLEAPHLLPKSKPQITFMHEFSISILANLNLKQPLWR